MADAYSSLLFHYHVFFYFSQLYFIFFFVGSGYLANIHFRKVKKLAPDYPHIDSLLEYLDRMEEIQAAEYRDNSLEVWGIFSYS